MIEHLKDKEVTDNEWEITSIRKPNIIEIQDKINEIIDKLNELLGDGNN